MNPNQRQPQPGAPGPQQQENNHKSQTQERKIEVREDDTIVYTNVETVLTPEQTVERYNSLVTQLRQVNKSAEAYDNKVAETLDEHSDVMSMLHTLVDDHPQDYSETMPVGEDAVDFISNQDLQRYHNIQEMSDQADQMRESIEESMDDLDQLWRAAKKMADRHGLELEDKPETVREEVWGENEEESSDE